MVAVADPEGLVGVANNELHHLLHQVDEEEPRAHHQLGQELQLKVLRRGVEAVVDLWQEMYHGGGQEDSASQA